MSCPEVALAILYQRGQFLMQLRDDIPGIAAPGLWGFFGGHIEPGETPEIALIREVEEEIGYVLITAPHKVGIVETDRVIRHIYAAPLTAEFEQLQLNEGWDLSLVAPKAIALGEQYSPIAQQVRQISPPHQKILLDFIEGSLIDWRNVP
ncbi:MAG: NUDIX domain-containing protein [Spirulina sp. SIO3F2]|nr:NUDIX domain-containing protein [Spirulina sp. SIO3F2]